MLLNFRKGKITEQPTSLIHHGIQVQEWRRLGAGLNYRRSVDSAVSAVTHIYV